MADVYVPSTGAITMTNINGAFPLPGTNIGRLRGKSASIPAGSACSFSSFRGLTAPRQAPTSA